MDEVLGGASRHLSRNLLNLRESRHLTQGSLASRAGLPRSTVTHIESGSGNPSLHNLIKLAAALRVSIEELIARPRTDVQLARAEDLPYTTKSKSSVRVTQLLPHPIPRTAIESVEIAVGERLVGAPHVAGSQEHITVVQGHLEIAVAGQTYRLRKRDVLSYPGDQPHRYTNVGRGMLTFMSVIVLASDTA